VAFNLERSANLFAGHMAVIQGGEQTTYGELGLRAGRITSGLQSLGLKPGDLVALHAPY
jgi:non-ribosomal peptide synthetase component E (peptide arylation enzyme)